MSSLTAVASGLVFVGFGYLAAALVVAAVVRMSALFPSSSARGVMLIFCVISAVGAIGTGFSMLQGGELGGFATLSYAAIFVIGQLFIWPWTILTYHHVSRGLGGPQGLETIDRKVNKVQATVSDVKEHLDSTDALRAEQGGMMGERVNYAIEMLDEVHFYVRELAKRLGVGEPPPRPSEAEEEDNERS